MDVNNVIIVLNPVQNSNFLFDLFSKTFSDFLFQLLLGFIAGIVSAYFVAVFSVKKGDALKFNRIMENVIKEIEDIEKRISDDFFNCQILLLRGKIEKRKKGEDQYIDIALDKGLNPVNQVKENRYLHIFWMTTLLNQYPVLLDSSENNNLSKKIGILQRFCWEIEIFNKYEKKCGSIFNDLCDNNPARLDEKIEQFSIKSKETFRKDFDSYIKQLDLENKKGLIQEVPFWSNIWDQLISIIKK